MNYKETLLDLIFNADDSALMSWIKSQPLIDQPEILRLLKDLVEEAMQKDGNRANLTAGELQEFTRLIDHYQDLILNEKLAEDNYIMAVEEQKRYERQFKKEMDERVEGVRKYVIECIVTNAPNAKEMRAAVPGFIKLEKEMGYYDPANWREVE